MWKLITEKGEKLPDLLVVLAITMVLAAILLPAVTSTHGNEVSAESGIQMDRVVMDGVVRPAMRARDERRLRTDAEVGAVTEDMSLSGSSPVADATVQPGIAQMLTTDISYTLP